MSGGHWDYNHVRIRDSLYNVGMDGNVIKEFPKLSQVMLDLAEHLYQTVHHLDYHISCDSIIKNPTQFEEQFIEGLGKIIKKKYKVRVYETEEIL